VYEHVGAEIVSLQIDCEHSSFVAAGGKYETHVYLMDETMKIHRIKSVDKNSNFVPVKTIDFSVHHPPLPIDSACWLITHVDSRTLTVLGRTYDLESSATQRLLTKLEKKEGSSYECQLRHSICDSRMTALYNCRGVPYIELRHSPGSRKVVMKGEEQRAYSETTPLTNNHILVNYHVLGGGEEGVGRT